MKNLKSDSKLSSKKDPSNLVIEENSNKINDLQTDKKKTNDKKTLNILKNSGMLDAYKCNLVYNIDLMVNLCKNGLPSGDLFEYAAFTIVSYEKKWKKIKSKETKEKIKEYWDEKEKGNEEGRF
jgi:hypothetical protein